MKRIALALVSLLSVTAWAADDYTVLDYVEATGTQWVDTGVVGRYDTKAEIKAEWTSDQGDMTMLASRGNDGTADNPTRINFMNGYRADYEDLSIGYGYGSYVHVAKILKDKKWHAQMWELERLYTVTTEFTKDGDDILCKMTVDGTSLVNGKASGFLDTGCNLALFGNNVSGTVGGLAKARCRGLKIWQKPAEDGVGDYALVRDFVPVLKDGRAGFRDAVSGDFFFSATDDDLVAGPSVNTPDLFVDYVESTGAEYVDLGVVGKTGVTMESRMAWVEVPGDGSYVASRKGADTRFYLYHHYQSDTLGYGGYYQSGVVAQPGVVQNVRTEMDAGAQSLSVDGAVRKSLTQGGTVDTGYSLYLFACHKDGAAVYNTKARCYSLKLWKDGALVRDFRPCLKGGRGALYDQVSRTIFHAGAGTLKAVRLPTPGRPDYFVEYVESKGDNYLDTGVRARSDVRAAGEFMMPVLRDTEEQNGLYLHANNEHTIIGACGKADGSERCYPAHVANTVFWFGLNDMRCYPQTTYPLDDDGEPVETRKLWDSNRRAFDVTLAYTNQTVLIDGEEICVSNVATTVDTKVNLYMFACNRVGTPIYQAYARIYSMKIWQKAEDGVGDYALVRDLHPCMKDGEGGFYDAVNDEILWLANAVPASRVGAPTEYAGMKPVERLEYVDSDGSQWIDTGVTGRVDTVAEFDMAWLHNGSDPDVGFLGSRRDSGNTRFYLWHNAHSLQSYAYGDFRYFNTANPSGPNWRDDSGHAPIETERKYHVKTSFLDARQTVAVDGVPMLDIRQSGSQDTGCTMYLFAYNYGTAVCKSAARLYELKIWQDGKLVRHFIPVRLNAGLNALYDTVEEKVYEPQGANFANWGPSLGAYKSNTETAIILR